MKRWLSSSAASAAGACGYNRIQSLDEQADAAQSQIEVQLQRRADLIPNLVQHGEGLRHSTRTRCSPRSRRARSGLVQRDPDARPRADGERERAVSSAQLGRLMVSVEAYPQLKADQSFLRLQDELTGTENRIAVSRNDYNQAVNAYNAYIRQFPAVVTAKVTGAKARKYFTASADRRAGRRRRWTSASPRRRHSLYLRHERRPRRRPRSRNDQDSRY